MTFKRTSLIAIICGYVLLCISASLLFLSLRSSITNPYLGGLYFIASVALQMFASSLLFAKEENKVDTVAVKSHIGIKMIRYLLFFLACLLFILGLAMMFLKTEMIRPLWIFLGLMCLISGTGLFKLEKWARKSALIASVSLAVPFFYRLIILNGESPLSRGIEDLAIWGILLISLPLAWGIVLFLNIPLVKAQFKNNIAN